MQQWALSGLNNEWGFQRREGRINKQLTNYWFPFETPLRRQEGDFFSFKAIRAEKQEQQNFVKTMEECGSGTTTTSISRR